MIHPYGRQWAHPKSAEAFAPLLLKADQLAISGKALEALQLYKLLAKNSGIAKRRLAMVARQIIHTLRLEKKQKSKILSINLGFIDWYDGFNEKNNFIIDLFTKAEINTVCTAMDHADILVAGCYGSNLMQQVELSRDKLVLFVSGENLRPSYDIHDFSLTTEWRGYCGKNVRYPQWYSDLKFEKSAVSLAIGIDEPFNVSSKRDYAISAIYNNSTPLREDLISCLRNAFGNENIHIFGSQRSGHVNKLEILSKSVINLCLENSLGEGYITEKLHHSLIMGCKSVYWGDKFFRNDFNDSNVLNLHEESDQGNCIMWCRKQLENPSAPAKNWNSYKRSNYSTQPSEDKAIAHIKKVACMINTWREAYI